MGSLAARLLEVTSVSVGGGSLVLFAWFLFFGPPLTFAIARTLPARLAFDSLLCLAFFVQHSGMVRQGAKRRLMKRFPAISIPALYSIASGAVLVGLVLLWQPTEPLPFALPTPARWLLVAIAMMALVGFAWGVRALHEFDPFGTLPLRAALRGTPSRPIPFVAEGAYRVVRHPLYLFMLLLIWCTSRLSLDRLLFDVLWTAWIVAGTKLEERDLRAEFGPVYREYQSSVPMLVPWPPRLPFGGRRSGPRG